MSKPKAPKKPKAPRKEKLRQRLRTLKREYLLSSQEIGVSAGDFAARIDTDKADHPEVYAAGMEDMLALARIAIWEEIVTDDDEPILPGMEGVGGAIRDLTYYNEAGEYRKVLVQFAAVQHLREDAIIKYGKVAETTKIAQKQMDLYWKLVRAGASDGTPILDAAIAAGIIPKPPEPSDPSEPPEPPAPSPAP